MGIADDLCDRAARLAAERLPWIQAWRRVAEACLPMAERMDGSGFGRVAQDLARGPKATERSRLIYDATTVTAVDRLAAGMESLVTPQAEKWHDLALDDPLAPAVPDEARQWLDRLRDYLFSARYDARSGFAMANQLALRSVVSLGTAVLFVEEGWGKSGTDPRRLPWLYRFVPLTQNHLAADAQGEVDTNFRRVPMTARQMVQRFGDRVSARVRLAAESERDKDRTFDVLHAIFPREERGSGGGTTRDSRWASFHVELETRHLIGESGYFEFPFVVYHWHPSEHGAYGESPVMAVLAEIQSTQVLARERLRAVQQWVRPPMATAGDGVMNRPNLNPGAVNPGAVDGATGRLRVQPILTVQNPSFADAVLEAQRRGIRESLHVTLFQALLDAPGMTATEAMLRANEKGELLGPAGAKIQAGLARMIERELGILERKGAFAEGSPLEPPPALRGRSFAVRFTAPLDRVRRAAEGLGILRTLEAAAALAQADPEVADAIDGDAALRELRDIFGAPARILRSGAALDALRQARRQEALAARGIDQVRAGAAAAKDLGAAAPGLAGLAQALGGS